MIKIFHTDEGNLHIFRMTQGILMKFAGRMSLEIGLYSFSTKCSFEKTKGVQIDLPISLFREKNGKYLLFEEVGSNRKCLHERTNFKIIKFFNYIVLRFFKSVHALMSLLIHLQH